MRLALRPAAQVRYLKVSEKSGYQALPWVRYISKSANDYDFRV
jgi:AP-1 complex subunit mu